MNDELDLYALPGHMIRRLHQQSTAVFVEHTKAAGFDLTSVQFAALTALAADAGLDQATLAKRIAYDRATIGGVIKRLEQKGLVSRKPDDEDRRALKVSLTTQGEAVLAQLAPVVHTLQARILPNLSETEKDSLLALMAKALRPAT